MPRWINNLFASHSRPDRPVRLGVESLERRDVPSITWVSDGGTFGILTGHIQVTGGAMNDGVTVSLKQNDPSTPYDDHIVVLQVSGGFGPYVPDSLKKTIQVKAFDRYLTIGSTHVPRISGIVADLDDGWNGFTNSTSVPCTVTGGADPDKLVGGSGKDVLKGEGGNDRLYGGSGADKLYGGGGVNGLYDGDGVDELTGGANSDRFLMDTTADTVIGYNSALDVKVTFANTTSPVTSGDLTFAAAAWTQDEIEEVDVALAAMHERLGNASLLKFNGTGITLRRVGLQISPPWDPADGALLGQNNWDTHLITVTGHAFGSDADLHETVIHEVGHNWDNEWGYAHGWLELSGWTQANPNSSGYTKTATADKFPSSQG